MSRLAARPFTVEDRRGLAVHLPRGMKLWAGLAECRFR